MHQMFRGVARFAAIAALTVGGGVLVAVPPAIADIGAEMQLACSGKAGTYKVPLRIETTVPSSGTVGQAVQMGTIKIDVGLPSELVKAVGAGAPAGAPTQPVTSITPSSAPPPALEGVAEIEVAVREAGGDRRVGWPAFALAAALPRGDDGTVHLTGSGVAPPVVPGSPGELSWSAGEVDLSLVPGDPVAEKDAAELALHCAAEKRTVFGAMQVKRRMATSTPGASSAPARQTTAVQEGLCESIPGAGSDPLYAVSDDDQLSAIYQSPSRPDGLGNTSGPGTMYCVKATGFVNVKKAGNAVPVALENLVRVPTENYFGNPFLGPNYQELRGYFVNRTYRTPATVLGFGFMPTRAVAETVQTHSPDPEGNDPITGNLRIIQHTNVTSSLPGGPEREELRAAAYVRVKASQAEVNGIPLNLGEKCLTGPTVFSAQAFMGNLQTGTSPYAEGQKIIVDNLEVPAFSGCGVGEDLSPILTASVSGSGNYANAESGWYCDVLNQNRCVNGQSQLPQTFTVKRSGDFTAVAKPFSIAQKSPQGNPGLSCDSATMRFHFDRGHWQSRFALGKGTMSLDGCKVIASDGSEYQVKGKVTQDGPLRLNMLEKSDGKQLARVNGVRLSVPVNYNGTQCTLRIGYTLTSYISPQQASFGSIVGTYDPTTKVFSIENNFTHPVRTSEMTVSPDSTCRIPGLTQFDLRFNAGTGDFVFPPSLEITSP
ncbi:hypothetical protein AB0C74_17415 [Spirillospora sp. NPDC048832]